MGVKSLRMGRKAVATSRRTSGEGTVCRSFLVHAGRDTQRSRIRRTTTSLPFPSGCGRLVKK
jgi:hypothetical protein